MVLQEIGNSGYDYVQDTTPSNADIGESWLKTINDNPTELIYTDGGWVKSDTSKLIESNLDQPLSDSFNSTLESIDSFETKMTENFAQFRFDQAKNEGNFSSGIYSSFSTLNKILSSTAGVYTNISPYYCSLARVSKNGTYKDGASLNYSYDASTVAKTYLKFIGSTTTSNYNTTSVIGNGGTMNLNTPGNVSPTGPLNDNPRLKMTGSKRVNNTGVGGGVKAVLAPGSKSVNAQGDSISNTTLTLNPTTHTDTDYSNYKVDDDQNQTWSFSNPPSTIQKVRIRTGSYHYSEDSQYNSTTIFEAGNYNSTKISPVGRYTYYNIGLGNGTDGNSASVTLGGDAVYTNNGGIPITSMKAYGKKPNSVDVNIDNVAGTQTYDVSNGSVTINVGVTKNTSQIEITPDQGKVSWSLNWDETYNTSSPSVSYGSNTVSYSGGLSETTTVERELTGLSASDDLSVSTNSGNVELELDAVGVTKTKNPEVSVNGNSVSYTGTLNDGETVDMTSDINESWINTGSNSLNFTVSTNTNNGEFKIDHRIGGNVGNVIFSEKDIGVNPSTVVLSQTVSNVSLSNTSADITYTITDSSNNSVTIDQTQIDTEVDVSSALTDSKITLTVNLSRGSGTVSSPRLEEVAAYFN